MWSVPSYLNSFEFWWRFLAYNFFAVGKKFLLSSPCLKSSGRLRAEANKSLLYVCNGYNYLLEVALDADRKNRDVLPSFKSLVYETGVDDPLIFIEHLFAGYTKLEVFWDRLI